MQDGAPAHGGGGVGVDGDVDAMGVDVGRLGGVVGLVDERVLGVAEVQQHRGQELQPGKKASSTTLGGQLVFLTQR